MNAFIDLNDCKEYTTVSLNNKDCQIKLAGTIDDPYFCGKDVCAILGYDAPNKALMRYVENEDKEFDF